MLLACSFPFWIWNRSLNSSEACAAAVAVSEFSSHHFRAWHLRARSLPLNGQLSVSETRQPFKSDRVSQLGPERLWSSNTVRARAPNGCNATMRRGRRHPHSETTGRQPCNMPLYIRQATIAGNAELVLLLRSTPRALLGFARCNLIAFRQSYPR
jgi:hypothetical protein